MTHKNRDKPTEVPSYLYSRGGSQERAFYILTGSPLRAPLYPSRTFCSAKLV